MIQLRFLGTGWSHGVPALGCTCRVCRERAPRNVRTRSSVLVRDGTASVVIDVGPDFRLQALESGLERVDAVFITHQHADHVMGLDDVRRFSWMQGKALPVWAEKPVLERMTELYPYATPSPESGQAVPLIDFSLWESPVQVGSLRFTSFQVPHGGLHCAGVRIDGPGGSIGYVPDCSGLPDEALLMLKSLDVMILNALRLKPHPAHLSLSQSLEWLEKINAPRSYLTHMGCPLDYHVHQTTLPEGVQMAHDGLTLNL